LRGWGGEGGGRVGGKGGGGGRAEKWPKHCMYIWIIKQLKKPQKNCDEIQNIFNDLISKFIMAKERFSEHEDWWIEHSQTAS
jgi:hypothetical protein